MKCTYFAMIAFCGSLFAYSTLQNQAPPKIQFQTLTVDFGDLQKGEKTTVQFPFTNKGEGQLEIRDIATSCGCTTAKQEKTSFAPGESGVIEVTFDSNRFIGRITKNVTVTTNNTKKPSTTLTITGHVFTEIESKPDSLFFADAKPGLVSEREIMVYAERLEKLEISELQVSPDYLSAKIEQLDPKTVRVRVMADGNKFPEDGTRHHGFVSFKTNSQTQPLIQTNVIINIVTPIQIRPPVAMFFASPQGKKREIDIRLMPTSDIEFQIETIESSLSFITVEKLAEDPTHRTVKVRLTAEAPEGRFNGKITIQTSHPEQKTVTIPIKGSVIKTS